MCSARCVALYSITGVLFLLFVYTLLSTQPFFLGPGVENVDHAKSSALGAMFLFLGMFVVSMVGIWRSGREYAMDGMSSSDYGGGNDRRGGSGRVGDYEYSRLNANLDYQPSGFSSSS